MSYQDVIEWLLSGDPSIRYLTHRDLLDTPKEEVENELMLMEIEEGWVHTILSNQEKNGTWKNGIINPRWTATLWVVTLLRRLGLSHHEMNFQLGGRVIFEKGQRMDGGYSHGITDPKKSIVCQSALILATMSYLRIKNPKREAIFEYLIESQMDDGGWSCKRKEGAKTSSFHTTLIVLEGLHEYSKANKFNLSTIEDLQQKGHEFLLKHELIPSLDGIVNNKFTQFTFPSRKQYSVLEAMDYFREIEYGYDERFEKAIKIIRDKKIEGRWKADYIQDGENWCDYEEDEMSRMISLKAMRIMRWWARISKFRY